MAHLIDNIRISSRANFIHIQWNMIVQDGRYVWTYDELVVRLFLPSDIELGALKTNKWINEVQNSETDTYVGEIGGGWIINATTGVNKSYEISNPMIRNHGRIQETQDGNQPHYRFSIDIAKLHPNFSQGLEEFSFDWEINVLANKDHRFQVRVEFGHLVDRVFQSEYEASRNISLPADLQVPIRRWLERVHVAINDRLNATVYELDRDFLDLEVGDESEAIVGSQLFKRYVIDIEALNTSEKGQLIHFDEAFEKHHHRLLLLGNAGAGKSTTLAVFAKSLIEEYLKDAQAKIPFYVPITNWRGETPLQNWIAQEAQLPSSMIQMIESGQVIFLVDGLDEIPASFEQDRATSNNPQDLQVEFLKRIREEFYGTDLVVTCRDSAYRDLLARNQGGIYLDGAVTIQPLTNDQIRSYLYRQSDLWEVVQRDNRLLDLVRTPLLLRIFATAFKGKSSQAAELALIEGGDGELRDEVFAAYVRQRCVHEAQKQPKRFLTESKIREWIDEIYDVLGKVAIQGRLHRTKQFEVLLGSKAEDFIDEMCNLHILMRTASGDIQFIHLLLEYHFAWEPLLDSVENRHPGWSPISRLGEIRDRRAVQPLIHAIKNGYGSGDRDIARALGEIGDSEAVPALIKLLAHRQRDTRRSAIEALGLIGDTAAVFPLTEMLDDSYSGGYPSDIQRSAVWALEQIGEDAVQTLCDKLTDERIRIRTEIARALAFIRDQRAIRPLIEALIRSEPRINVPYPNFFWGYVDPTNTLLRVEERTAQFIHVDTDISMYVFALAAIGQSAIEPLTNLYKNASEGVKECTVWALAQIEDTGLIDFFMETLTSGNDKVKTYSVYGLAKNCGLSPEKDYRPIQKLINTINERPISSNLFDCTLWTLGAIGHTVAVNVVIHIVQQLTNDYPRSKFHAVGGLGLSGDKRATTTLISFLKDDDRYVRVCTAQALGRLKDVSAVDALLSSLTDEDGEVRRHVIEALGEIGETSVVRSIVSHFGDDTHSVSEALLKLGDTSILPELSYIGETDERQHVRQAASKLILRLKLQTNYGITS